MFVASSSEPLPRSSKYASGGQKRPRCIGHMFYLLRLYILLICQHTKFITKFIGIKHITTLPILSLNETADLSKFIAGL